MRVYATPGHLAGPAPVESMYSTKPRLIVIFSFSDSFRRGSGYRRFNDLVAIYERSEGCADEQTLTCPRRSVASR